MEEVYEEFLSNKDSKEELINLVDSIEKPELFKDLCLYHRIQPSRVEYLYETFFGEGKFKGKVGILEKHKLLLMIGKSASGKDTIAKAISKKGYRFLTPCTTRPMRVGESEGDPYHFISEHDIDEKMIGRTSFSTAHGIWYYGFKKQELDPNTDYVAVLNPGQIKELYEYHSKTHEVVIIWIKTDEELRILKAIEREKSGNNDYAELCRRFVADAKDFSDIRKYVWNNTKKLYDDYITALNDFETDPEEIAEELLFRI